MSYQKIKDFIYLHEEAVTLVLGALVVLVVSILIVSYLGKHPEQAELSEETYCRTGYSNISLKDTPNKCLKYFIKGGENIYGQ